MKSKYHFILLISIVFTLLACNDRQKKAYLLHVEKLSHSIDSLDSVVNTFNIDRSDSVSKLIEQNLNKIRENYNKDTISISLAKDIESYKEILNALSTNSGNLAKAKSAIPDEQKKLKDLKHDIKNGVNDRSKYGKFIQFEAEKVKKIKEIVTYYNQTNEQYLSRYDALREKIENYANSLSQ